MNTVFVHNLGLGGRTANRFELFFSRPFFSIVVYTNSPEIILDIGLSKLGNEMMLRARILTVGKKKKTRTCMEYREARKSSV